MKRLILMRHGDAPRSIDRDEERILSSKGMQEVEQTARYLNKHYKLEHILCSPAKRNRQTLEIIQQIINDHIASDFCDIIYQNDTETLKELVESCEVDGETILLLGHSPSLLTFALQCDKNGYHEWIDLINHGLVPAEVIIIEFQNAGTWAEAMMHGGKIQDIFIPK